MNASVVTKGLTLRVIFENPLKIARVFRQEEFGERFQIFTVVLIVNCSSFHTIAHLLND